MGFEKQEGNIWNFSKIIHFYTQDMVLSKEEWRNFGKIMNLQLEAEMIIFFCREEVFSFYKFLILECLKQKSSMTASIQLHVLALMKHEI